MRRFIEMFTELAWQRWLLAIFLSACVHLSVWAFKTPERHAPKRKKFRVVKFRLVRPRPRKVKKRPKPKRKKPVRRRPKPRKRKKKFKKRKRKRRRQPPPRRRRVIPPPNRRPRKPPPRNAPPPRPIFGVTMSSLAKGKGTKVAVRVGNTLMKDPDKKIVDPSKVRPYYAPRRVEPPPRRRDVFRPVPVYEVDENPRELRKARAVHPAAAKRRGIQARVVLSVQIRKSGRVRFAKVISVRPSTAKGFGFGKAAVAALRRFRFHPARYKGKPVDVVVRYIYRFELED